MFASWLIYTLFLILTYFWLIRSKNWQKSGLDVKSLTMGFSLRLLAGIAFVWVYTFYYGNGKLSMDAGHAIDQSKMLYEVFWVDQPAFWKLFTGIGETEALVKQYMAESVTWDAGSMTMLNDAKNVTRFNTVIYFFSQGNPFLHAGVMSLISFIGIVALSKVMFQTTRFSQKTIFWMLNLLPNTLFWGSGILKEPFVLFGLGLTLLALFMRSNKLKWIFLVVGIASLLLFKAYILAFFSLALAFYWFVKKYAFSPWKVASIGMVFIFGLLYLVNLKGNKPLDFFTKRQIDFQNVARGGVYIQVGNKMLYIDNKYRDFVVIQKDSVTITSDQFHFQEAISDPYFRLKPSSLKPKLATYFLFYDMSGSRNYYELTPIQGSFWQLIKNIPEALINTLLRPLPMDGGTVFIRLAQLETALLLLWLVLVWRNRRNDFSSKNELVALLVFIFGLSLIIGWFTCVPGAIVRYRIPVYLAVLWISFYCIEPSWKKIEK